MIIGIMGKVGSGKSLCVKYIKEHYDAFVFSCDEIAKELIESGQVDYKIESPRDFFTDERLQEVCREKVHKPVFLRICENINNLSKLYGINEDRLCVIETALPNDMFLNICDKTIYVDNTLEKKIEILKEHRDYTETQTKLIYESQKYYEKFYIKADYKISNNENKEELLEKLKEVMDEVCIFRK